MKILVQASILSGTAKIPASKSHTLRAILFASLAAGESVVRNYLISPDTTAMIKACEALGAKIKILPDELRILGTAGHLKTPDNVIDAGNSGIVFRFISAIAALLPDYTVITGDDSIRHNRPITPLLQAIQQLGGFAVSTKQDGHAPVIIKGPIQGGLVELMGEDSQPVSGLLIAAAMLKNPTEIHVFNPGEKPWVELTLSWFRLLNIEYVCDHYHYYKIFGKSKLKNFDYTVPSDFSSAAIIIIAALITHSEITVTHIDLQDAQGDKEIINVLQNLGANIIYDSKHQLLEIKKSILKGGIIDVNNYIDAVPILAVLGCFTTSILQMTGAAIAKQKESNRLSSMKNELSKMQACIAENPDGLLIEPKHLYAAEVNSSHDHRVAMSLAVAGLAAKGTTIINESECIAKSFPNFVGMMQQLGATIRELP